MESIFIIKDNRLYDEMRDLREAVIRRIESNICELQKDGIDVRVCSTSDNPAENDTFIKKHGYKKEASLYDKLIIEHNNTKTNILYGWPRPDEEC